MQVRGAIALASASIALASCSFEKITGFEENFGASTGTVSTTSGGSSTGALASSTGGASSSSSSTGTTGGSPPDGGRCAGVATNLQNAQVYSDGPQNLSNSADFNGDGLLDVVLAPNDGTFSVLLGLADGGLAAAGSPFFVDATPSYGIIGPPIVAADVNGDGLPDILFVGKSGIDFVPNVAGELTIDQPLIAAQFIGALAVADLNLDGIPDIVEVETAKDSTVNTFIGLGGGAFARSSRLATLPVTGQYVSPARLFVSDLNQDGFPDIGAVAYSGQQLEILIRTPDGGYQNSYYAFPFPITVAPVPRTGAPPDIVVGYDVQGGGAGLLQLLVNAGDGTFTMGPIYDVPNTIDQLAVSDFNGDCLMDVATSGSVDNFAGGFGISVLFGEPDGGFGPAQSVPGYPLGPLVTLGLVSNPRALAVCTPYADGGGFTVFGDASRH